MKLGGKTDWAADYLAIVVGFVIIYLIATSILYSIFAPLVSVTSAGFLGLLCFLVYRDECGK